MKKINTVDIGEGLTMTTFESNSNMRKHGSLCPNLAQQIVDLEHTEIFTRYQKRIGDIVTVHQTSLGNPNKNVGPLILLGEGVFFILPKKYQRKDSYCTEYIRAEVMEVKRAKGNPVKEGYPWIIISHKTKKAKLADDTPIQYKLYNDQE